MYEDRHMSIRVIAKTINTNKGTVRKILHDELNMKLVPKNLITDQKLVCQQICSDFLVRLDEEPELMEKIITCDETWIFQYTVEIKRQSMHWKTPALPKMKKARISKSKFKAMLIIFFDISGIVMTEWVPEGQTLNQIYYLKVLAILAGIGGKKVVDLAPRQRTCP